MVIENRDVSAVKSCWASHFKITAKCVGELDLARRPALHLEQGGAGDNYRHASSTRDSHVQPVQAVQEFHSPRCVLWGRSCHRVENNRSLLPLELVHRSNSRPCGKPFSERRDLCVVRSDNQDVLNTEGVGFAILVRPGGPRPQQIIHGRGNFLDFFLRLVLVSRMFDGGKTQARPAQRIAAGIETLFRVFRT